MEINDITYAVRGAVFEVNRALGSGFLEKVYENALLVELRKRGLKADSQVPVTVGNISLTSWLKIRSLLNLRRLRA
jgi:GxxExxY protein